MPPVLVNYICENPVSMSVPVTKREKEKLSHGESKIDESVAT